jgi:hypothetical protein
MANRHLIEGELEWYFTEREGDVSGLQSGSLEYAGAGSLNDFEPTNHQCESARREEFIFNCLCKTEERHRLYLERYYQPEITPLGQRKYPELYAMFGRTLHWHIYSREGEDESIGLLRALYSLTICACKEEKIKAREDVKRRAEYTKKRHNEAFDAFTKVYESSVR